MKRTICAKAGGALAFLCSATLVLAVTAAQARPTNTVGHQAATAQAVSKCSIVISGTPWHIRAGGTISGNKYTITAHGMPCSGLARTWVLKFINRSNPGPGKTFQGPSGFICHSFTSPAAGAKLLISGVCAHQPSNNPFFGWGPKVR
jgi:hypothetical protein